MRIAVIGHVEHVTLGRVVALPGLGDIVHLDEPRIIAGGGGGVTFFQLVKSPAQVVLFTALGGDAAGAEVEAMLVASGAALHLARRAEPHTRDIVLLTPEGERTIVVLGWPQHPRFADPLPWDELAACDAAYFTGQDPETLRAARQAKLLIVSARRREALDASGVRADVVVGSRLDSREVSALADYRVRPGALVLTAGAEGGRIETAAGYETFAAPPPPPVVRSSYGAGDSFVGALVWFLASGVPLAEACVRAGAFGVAVLRDHDTIAAQARLG